MDPALPRQLLPLGAGCLRHLLPARLPAMRPPKASARALLSADAAEAACGPDPEVGDSGAASARCCSSRRRRRGSRPGPATRRRHLAPGGPPWGPGRRAPRRRCLWCWCGGSPGPRGPSDRRPGAASSSTAALARRLLRRLARCPAVAGSRSCPSAESWLSRRQRGLLGGHARCPSNGHRRSRQGSHRRRRTLGHCKPHSAIPMPLAMRLTCATSPAYAQRWRRLRPRSRGWLWLPLHLLGAGFAWAPPSCGAAV
mmetsp:Transcript_63729/g.137029  ORF Transcript_63729/g.137029 Transcript_63729/m.137029 type:complete len:255 (+) Transcript_63729:706-1470(+)